jgi:acylphosphatase
LTAPGRFATVPSLDGMPTYRYVVRGLVQGVGYRYFALKRAEELSLRGFVRNLPDGSVEVVAEGEQELLAEFETKLREGPSFARVEHVERTESQRRGDSGFHIR